MNKQTIGIVGYGFVGQAVARGLCPVANVVVYDKDPEKGLFSVEECVEGWAESMPSEMTMGLELSRADALQFLISRCAIIFVCIPTPMNTDGSCNTSIVEDVVGMLDAASPSWSPRPIVVIKSTVPPGTTAKLQEKCPWIDLVFNPEFLTEANSLKDFVEQDRVVLGGVGGGVGGAITAGVDEVSTLYREFGLARQTKMPRHPKIGQPVMPPPTIQLCSSTEAEMIKYLTNCFLATKVALANEFAQLCGKVGADWDTVWRLASKDDRLGSSHWQVPGPDGKPGFGGSCFPKDVCGMIEFMKKNGVSPQTLLGVWCKNIEVRPERDWEKLKGRAVT